MVTTMARPVATLFVEHLSFVIHMDLARLELATPAQPVRRSPIELKALIVWLRRRFQPLARVSALSQVEHKGFEPF